jgi:hypothetical protein
MRLAWALLLVSSAAFAQTFTEVGVDAGVGTSAPKFAGMVFADFNNDGCLDLAVNTFSVSVGTRLYRGNCQGPTPTYVDITSTHAAGFLSSSVTVERSALAGDLNGDGLLDFLRQGSTLELYQNRGAAEDFKLGDSATNASFVIADPYVLPDGGVFDTFNPEGVGFLDWNADGWLDFIFESTGIDLYENPKDGGFTFERAAAPGLPRSTTSSNGDYIAVTDLDVDGWVDLVSRGTTGGTVWFNDAGASWTVNVTPQEVSSNTNKGSVSTCDFDNDGDFDIFYSDFANNPNRVWLQGPPRSFAVTTEPVVPATAEVEGSGCGDLDHDGDLDLFLGVDGGISRLFLNDTTDAGLAFHEDNRGIAAPAVVYAVVFVDYDNDGDLDLALNGDPLTQIWRNDLNDNRYLKVRVLRDTVPGGPLRDELGATLHLEACDGGRLSGEREVNGGTGRGTQQPLQVHFGLPDGPGQVYVVRVQHVGGGISRVAVVPDQLGSQHLVSVIRNNPDDLAACFPADAGSADGGSGDAGSADAGSVDGGPVDGGVDAGITDAGVVDGGADASIAPRRVYKVGCDCSEVPTSLVISCLVSLGLCFRRRATSYASKPGRGPEPGSRSPTV